jgi:hypothetical protein
MNDRSKSIVRDRIIGEGRCFSMRWMDISHGCLKISNSLVIVAILLVYSISHPKNMLTALVPTLVNLRSLPIENNILPYHFGEMK